MATKTDRPYIICPRCGRVSHHGRDIKTGWCGFCEDWTGAFHHFDQAMPEQSDHYDRQGNPITLGRWTWLNSGDRFQCYRRVAETVIEDFRVSTVWLGLNYDFSFHGPPIIFETMIFQDVGGGERATVGDLMWRWATEADAIEGHEQAITLITAAGEALREALTEVEEEQPHE